MRDLAKVLFAYLLKIVLFPLRVFPVKNDRLVFTALTGGEEYEYCGSPRYLCDDIRRRKPGTFQTVWIVARPERYREAEESGILFLKHYRPRSFYYLLTAKVIVTSGSYAPWFPFRPDQYLINTWHGGGAYKRLKDHYDTAGWAARKKLDICAGNIRLFLSSCRMASQLQFREAFHYRGEILESGMPRNDHLVRGETQKGRKNVHRRYGIPKEDKIVLYAPTCRRPEKDVILDADALLSCLNGGGQVWHFLYRAHRYQADGTGIAVKGQRVQEAGDYPDMQELLCAADLLITDYSSSIWDYSFLMRPCFLYTPDLEEYRRKNGFYVDICDWPFPVCMDQEELQRQIRALDMEEMKKKIEAHHRMMGSFERGHACGAAAKRIMEVCGK